MSVEVTAIPENEELVDSRGRINTNFSNLKTAVDEKENGLGVPTEEGQILVSSVEGVRSWKTPDTGGQYLGTATTKAIAYNAQSISEDITVPATANAYSCGPITISDGFTVTVEDGGLWQVF